MTLIQKKKKKNYASVLWDTIFHELNCRTDIHDGTQLEVEVDHDATDEQFQNGSLNFCPTGKKKRVPHRHTSNNSLFTKSLARSTTAHHFLNMMDASITTGMPT